MQVAFTSKKDYGRGEREAQWALAQRTLHGLQAPDSSQVFDNKSYKELSEIAEQAKRRAEVARYIDHFQLHSVCIDFLSSNSFLFDCFAFVNRLRELHTLKGHVESVVKLKGLDIETIQQHYTV